tara:strand:+ start:70 stop:216 length:147 start_codon:yes stop_codon:yes gene_type:complete
MIGIVALVLVIILTTRVEKLKTHKRKGNSRIELQGRIKKTIWIVSKIK